MCCTSETVILSTETNLRLLFANCSMCSEETLVSLLVGQLMKIYNVARSASIYRLAFGGTSFLPSQLLNRANQSLLKGCGLQPQGRRTTESLGTDLDSKPCCLEVTAEKLLSFGKTRLQQIFGEDSSTSLNECELLRICKSALGLSLGNCLPNTGAGCTSIGVCQNGDSLSRALWHVAEEKWKDATDMLSDYTPDKMLHSAVELAHDRMNELIYNNCLVSQLSEAGDFLMSTTQCIKTEAEVLSQLLYETQEHALAGMAEFWNMMNEYSHLACDGIELFSQYIWNTTPEFYEPALLDVNLFNMDDEDLLVVAEEPMPRRRRSMLYIGSR
ncbi:uncharacterized protein LOC111336707 [Stylophora pistillata]|uniref:Uncharacterized protein n=1 Tax=Stylophora pistillata TaxID=50429 RepID=A0A2B4RTU2_STYPI|nr:uncharacterized protein LOC111336707 [Stylophora pistillata]XP_022798581.1 uncharacterized protein LOC111336707 [Stylophora pistillata]PFX20586.1 hypothetical protein AWC38_SpisGene14960 [Stylophora pistillata]